MEGEAVEVSFPLDQIGIVYSVHGLALVSCIFPLFFFQLPRNWNFESYFCSFEIRLLRTSCREFTRGCVCDIYGIADIIVLFA